MSELRLQAKELLYLSARLGAEAFYGIDDAFAGEEEAQIRLDVLRAEDSLVAKGYGNMDFDGKFALTDESDRIVRACALCEGYSTVWSEESRITTSPVLYYCKDDVLVELTHAEDELLLREVTVQQMLDGIWDAMRPEADGKDIDQPFTLETDDIMDIRIGGGNAGCVSTQLVRLGCGQGIAPVLSAVLCGGGRTSTLLTLRFTDEEAPMLALTVMMADGKAVVVEQSEDEKGVPTAIFTCADEQDISARIAAAAIGCKADESGV